MLRSYLNIAWRNLWKHKVQSVINITGLSIGMTATLLILLWVRNELNFDSYHAGTEHIYRITNTYDAGTDGIRISEQSPYILGASARKELPEVQLSAMIKPVNKYKPLVIHRESGANSEVSAAYVNEDWFRLFSYSFLSGGTRSFFSNPRSLLLTESYAKKYFGRTDIAGETLLIDTIDFQVSGVIKDDPSNSSFSFGIFIPISLLQTDPVNRNLFEQWGGSSVLTFLKLSDRADPAATGNKLTAMSVKGMLPWKSTTIFKLLPLKDLHFESGLSYSSIRHGERSRVTLFTLLAFLLLFIACINYVNLVTARASLRTREVGVRKINGASRLQLFRQFFIETALISFISLGITLLLVVMFLPIFNDFTESRLIFSLFSAGELALVFGTFIAVVILASSYPALLLSSFKPISLFRGINVFAVKDAPLRRGLVVIQFAVSIALIISVLVIYSQQRFMKTEDNAFNRAQVFSVLLPIEKLAAMKSPPHELFKNPQRDSWYAALKQALSSDANISGVTYVQAEIDNLNGSSFLEGPQWNGKQKADEVPTGMVHVDTDFAKIFNVKIIAGRWFTGDKGDVDRFVINETALRSLNIPPPVIGTEISLNNITGKIVGVVKDFHTQSFHEKIGPLLLANTTRWYTRVYIKAPAGGASGAVKAAGRVFKEFAPEAPFEYIFMDESFDALYRSENKAWTILNIFTCLIVFVSCLGIFGLAAHTAGQRTKEIGIRKVLGATVSGITALLSKDFLKPVLISIFIACPVAWWFMKKWLQDYAYQVQLQWWMFALAGFSALAIALMTVSFQAIKAAMANPVRSLRSE